MLRLNIIINIIINVTIKTRQNFTVSNITFFQVVTFF